MNLALTILLGSLFVGPLAVQAAEQRPDPCSLLNHCVAEKKTFGKKGWKTNYTKELKLGDFCGSARPVLELENDLGLDLLIHGTNEDPKVVANLHTYKLTYVVASASVEPSATYLQFSYRLRPRGSSVVEVTCRRR